ncbi:uncharacterized protein EI90DRAFT_2179428 [Cantharellus anzutake]|uniref:uncharacterized protein n=1 Tax=Cantharellus anzutake TaxID=1750568 RepID=UPI00190891F6|nr:uncharacterized protein EI90DRAFT_2179428 [Cantharellus anzutake]KAF8325214.1 hypothetical protein EI90DRAFT_2179428 [Cantharellus anzutake]
MFAWPLLFSAGLRKRRPRLHCLENVWLSPLMSETLMSFHTVVNTCHVRVVRDRQRNLKPCKHRVLASLPGWSWSESAARKIKISPSDCQSWSEKMDVSPYPLLWVLGNCRVLPPFECVQVFYRPFNYYWSTLLNVRSCIEALQLVASPFSLSATRQATFRLRSLAPYPRCMLTLCSSLTLAASDHLCKWPPDLRLSIVLWL